MPISLLEERPDPSAVVELYRVARLTARPLEDPSRIEKMFEGSNVVWVAKEDDRLVGLFRGLTDGKCIGYVCELVVRGTHQLKGIAGEPHPELSVADLPETAASCIQQLQAVAVSSSAAKEF